MPPLILLVDFLINETGDVDDGFLQLIRVLAARHYAGEIRMIGEIHDTAVMQLALDIPCPRFAKFVRHRNTSLHAC